MAVRSLDTHEIVKDLKSAGFTDEQAGAVTRAVKKAQDLDLSHLATKADLAELRRSTKTDLAELQAATRSDLAELRADLAELRGATKADLAELRAELIKWVVGVGFAQVAMILAVLKSFPAAHP